MKLFKKRKEQTEEEGGEKRPVGKKKLIIMIAAVLLVAVAVVAVLFLKRNKEGGEEEGPSPIDPPQGYELGETILPALPVLNEGILVYEETPDEKSEAESEETEEGEETETVSTTAVTYRYEGLTDAAGLAAAYAGLLSAGDVGFTYVDGTFVKTDAPDFEEPAAEGVLHLAKAAPEEGLLLSVQLQWAPGQCTVTVDSPEGSIAEPPTPEPITLLEAVDFFASLPPAVLGLEGGSMQDYNIYSLDGVVLVDGQPCIHMNVYSVDEELGTNRIAGEYFMSSDRRHIYMLDTEGNMVEIAALG